MPFGSEGRNSDLLEATVGTSIITNIVFMIRYLKYVSKWYRRRADIHTYTPTHMYMYIYGRVDSPPPPNGIVPPQP